MRGHQVGRLRELGNPLADVVTAGAKATPGGWQARLADELGVSESEQEAKARPSTMISAHPLAKHKVLQAMRVRSIISRFGDDRSTMYHDGMGCVRLWINFPNASSDVCVARAPRVPVSLVLEYQASPETCHATHRRCNLGKPT